MLPNRGPEGDRHTLPPISAAISSHDSDSARGERPMRAPLQKPDAILDETMRDRRPSSSLEHHRGPPVGLLPRLQREMEPLRAPSYPRPPADDAYVPPGHPKFAHAGPAPPPFPRDLERGSPVSDEAGWRSVDRPDARFGANDPYSPRMPPAPYAAREEGRQPLWPRASDEPMRPRMSGPPAQLHDDGPWRSASTSRDRADMHPDAFAHERSRDEDRWRDERGPRPSYPYEGPAGYPPTGPSPYDARSGLRPLDADHVDDGRRIRRRATSGVVDEDPSASRYSLPGARPYGSGTYSPPESRSHSAASNHASMRPAMLAGMEPPRPASSLGVMNQGGMPHAPIAPSSATSQAPTTANTVNANRRVAHLLSEQKRRESINTGFEDLRQAIPACRDGQDSKATILKRALEYIRELESVVDRQHRQPYESHALGGYSNRSPPDDKDDLRRFGRPGGDEERRGSNSGRQMAGSSGSSGEAGHGPRIGGLPSNAYGGAPNGYPSAHNPQHLARGHPSYASPKLPLSTFNAPMEPVRGMHEQARSESTNGSNDRRGSMGKRWAEDSDEGQRSPSRRRVSDGDKEDVQRSPAGPNYMIAHNAQPRAALLRSPTLDKPRDWHSGLDNRSLVDSAVRA